MYQQEECVDFSFVAINVVDKENMSYQLLKVGLFSFSPLNASHSNVILNYYFQFSV